MTASSALPTSDGLVDLTSFYGGRLERRAKGITFSITADILYLKLRGNYRWTQRLALSVTNMQRFKDNRSKPCWHPTGMDQLFLKHYDVRLLAGNCLSLVAKNDGLFSYTMYPASQNWHHLEEQFQLSNG